MVTEQNDDIGFRVLKAREEGILQEEHSTVLCN